LFDRLRLGAHQLFATWNTTRFLGRLGRWSLKAVWISLALIGFLHLTRGTAVRHVEGIGADDAPIAVSEAAFTAAWIEATGILATGRPTLRPLDDGARLAGPDAWQHLR